MRLGVGIWSLLDKLSQCLSRTTDVLTSICSNIVLLCLIFPLFWNTLIVIHHTFHMHIINIMAPGLLLKQYLLFKQLSVELLILLGSFSFIPLLRGGSVPPCTDCLLSTAAVLFTEQLDAQIHIKLLMHSICFWQGQAQQQKLGLQAGSGLLQPAWCCVVLKNSRWFQMLQPALVAEALEAKGGSSASGNCWIQQQREMCSWT